MGFHDEPGVSILITNISDTPLIITQHLGATKFESVWADARDLSQFKNNEFDVVFSNSVIEHVGAIKDQEAMMREVRETATVITVMETVTISQTRGAKKRKMPATTKMTMMERERELSTPLSVAAASSAIFSLVR